VPLEPSLILLYEGDNDLSSGESVEQVFAEYKTFLRMVHQRFPKTKVAIYTLRPSLAREQNRSKQIELNALFRKYCKKHKKKAFLIEGDAALLTPEGRPNGDLLVEDQLHLNAKGYAVWSRLTLEFLKTHHPR
jgi:lysophospholipase L1-like esterase